MRGMDVTCLVLMSVIVGVCAVLYVYQSKKEGFGDANAHLLGTAQTLQTTNGILSATMISDQSQYNVSSADQTKQTTVVIPQATALSTNTYADIVYTQQRIRDLQNQVAAIQANIPMPNTPTLAVGKILYSDGMNMMRSPNGQYAFTLQNNGSATLTHNGTAIYTAPIWRAAVSTCFMIMQPDSNLVIYDTNGPLWASGTNGRGVEALILDNNGGLYLYTDSGTRLYLATPFAISRGYSTQPNNRCNGALVCLDRFPVGCGEGGINSFLFHTPSSDGNGGQYSGNCSSGPGILSGEALWSRATPWQNNGGDWSTSASIFLDRQNVSCPSDSVLSSFVLQDSWSAGAPPNNVRYLYSCAKSKQPLTCRGVSTPFNDEGGGNTIFLDRHNVACNANEILQQFHLSRSGQNTFRYDYTCCKTAA